MNPDIERMAKEAAIEEINAIALRAGMPSYTNLRETLRVVQENFHAATLETLRAAKACDFHGLTPELEAQILAEDAEVMRRVKQATPMPALSDK